MARSQIHVNANPVADRYANEKIISFTITPDDQLDVHVYRQDLTVNVTAGTPGQPVHQGNLRMDKALYQAALAFIADWESRH